MFVSRGGAVAAPATARAAPISRARERGPTSVRSPRTPAPDGGPRLLVRASRLRGPVPPLRSATLRARPRPPTRRLPAFPRATAEPVEEEVALKTRVVEFKEEALKTRDPRGALERGGLILVVLAATIASLAAAAMPLRYASAFVVETVPVMTLAEGPARTGLATLVRLLGAANVLVGVAAAALIPDAPPRKMRRVVQAALFVYGACHIAIACIAQNAGLWSEVGKWLAHSHGGFLVVFFAWRLLVENRAGSAEEKAPEANAMETWDE